MISTMENEMYESKLKGWRRKTFNTVGRMGAYVEVIYMNYPEPYYLHQYTHVGNNHLDRQRIKRKADRLDKKMQCMDIRERHFLMSRLIETHKEEIQHLMLKHRQTK